MSIVCFNACFPPRQAPLEQNHAQMHMQKNPPWPPGHVSIPHEKTPTIIHCGISRVTGYASILVINGPPKKTCQYFFWPQWYCTWSWHRCLTRMARTTAHLPSCVRVWRDVWNHEPEYVRTKKNGDVRARQTVTLKCGRCAITFKKTLTTWPRCLDENVGRAEAQCSPLGHDLAKRSAVLSTGGWMETSYSDTPAGCSPRKQKRRRDVIFLQLGTCRPLSHPFPQSAFT